MSDADGLKAKVGVWLVDLGVLGEVSTSMKPSLSQKLKGLSSKWFDPPELFISMH